MFDPNKKRALIAAFVFLLALIACPTASPSVAEQATTVNRSDMPATNPSEVPGSTPVAPAATPAATPVAPAATPAGTPVAPAATPAATPVAPAASPDLPLKGKVILVDAGHGGIDPGTSQPYSACGLAPKGGSRKIEEKDITLSIAFKLRDQLEALGATVYMTRETDVKVENTMKEAMQADLSLTPRGKREHIAPRPADMAIAIHVNYVRDRSIDDIELYSYYKPGLDLSHSILSAMQAKLHRHVRSIHPMDFAVIDHNPSIPTVLIETGYITHPSTCRDLISSSYQNSLVDSVADGVVRFYDSTNVP